MKIGIFDSGLGGLFLMRPIAEALPRYDYLYLGDTAKLPYGDKSPNEVYRLALKAVKYLLEHNCELVLVLCNTISAEALRKMQMEFLPKHFPKRRILGIIIPTVEAVYQLYTQPHDRELMYTHKKIGILATHGTVISRAYVREIHKLLPDAQVFQQSAPKLVPMIESGVLRTLAYARVLNTYLKSLLAKNINTLILGCTHYPILKSHIKKLLPAHVRLICQNEIISEKLKTYLTRHPEIESQLTRSSSHQFLVTMLTPHFEKEAKAWFGDEIKLEEVAY